MTERDIEGTSPPRPEEGSRDGSLSRLGRYAILGALGRGGMGEVFRARAFGAAGATKEVCLKRIGATRLADRQSVARFVEEARLSLALTHANIVSTFDFGRAENDYYLAMEWIDGADLSRIVDGAECSPFSAALVAHVGAEVARALAYAHEPTATRPGIVHCDVKPSNVLVSRSGDVLLADFGVAVVRLEGMRGGTPRYMAPEQRLGTGVGPAVDVFALGVVLGAMLERATSRPAELTAILERMTLIEPTDRPSAREVATLLEHVVARARLAGEAAPRDDLGRRAAAAAPTLDATPSMLVAESSYLRDGEENTESRLTATTGSRSTPPPPPPKRWRRAVAPVVSVVLLALVTLVSTRWLGPASAPARAPAPAPSSTAAEDARTTTAVAPAPEPATAPELVVEAPAIEPTHSPSEPARGSRRPRTRAVVTAAPRETPAPRETLLEPAREARLRVNAIPWATVELDGRALGTTPLTDIHAAPGPHVLHFRNEVLGVDRVERLTLAEGEHRDVIVDLR